MTSACLSTAYLAPVSYYKTLCNRDHIIVEKCCNYVKQTYRNRCNIISANGLIPLSVPVIKPDTAKCLTRDIRISDHDNWQHMHWNAIVSAYGSSPFFEYYQDDIIPFFEKTVVVDRMLEMGECIDSSNANGETALMMAVKRNNRKMIEYLLEKGASPNIPDILGITPLMVATFNNQLYNMALLHYYGAFVGDVCAEYEFDAFDIADITQNSTTKELLMDLAQQ